jgi:hypothetical protein
VLWIEARPGQALKGMALSVHGRETAWPIGATKLALKEGRFSGEVKVSVIPRPSMHNERVQRKNAIVDYKPDPVNDATFTLDVRVNGRVGTGTYQAAWSTRNLIDANRVPKSGTVSVLRHALVVVPERYEIDCEMSTALAELNMQPGVWIRAAMKGDGLTDLRVYAKPEGSSPGQPLTVTEPRMNFRNGELNGGIKASLPFGNKAAFELSFRGTCVGRNIHGEVKLMQGGKTIATTPWLGFVRDGAYRTPLDYPYEGWTWQYDLPPDETLVAKAKEEAGIPVLPGEPGKAAFWTWRRIASRVGSKSDITIASIHPPSFDIEEAKGATSYRYQVVGGRDPVIGIKADFTSDVPWRAIAPVWKDLPFGVYGLKVIPLKVDGSELPGSMRLRVQEKTKYFGKPVDFTKPIPKPAWETREMDTIWFTKRRSYSGPYFKPRWGFNQTALDIARWQCEPVGKLQNRGQTSLAWYVGGAEGSFAWDSAVYLWATLATRGLSNDPVEREQAESMLPFLATEMELHQRISPVFWAYKGMTPLSRWAGEAALDAWVQTGDTRWREIVLRYARALVKIQNEDGSFQSWYKGKLATPVVNHWPEGHPAFIPSELLYCLGRIRRDLGTDEFLAAEKKALGYMRNVAVPERNFPCYVHHSHSVGYPVWQHPISALTFTRYLLELAPKEDRDVKLAEEVARWAEDYGVLWDRAPDGPQTGQVRPGIPSGDRFNGSPIAGNVLAAIAFELLSRETGNGLWHAKAEALAAAVSQGQDPVTHYPGPELDTGKKDYGYYHASMGESKNLYMGYVGSWGLSVQLLREYAALRAEQP